MWDRTGIPETKRDPVVLWHHYTFILEDPVLFAWKIVGFLLFWFFKQCEGTIKILGKWASVEQNSFILQ